MKSKNRMTAFYASVWTAGNCIAPGAVSAPAHEDLGKYCDAHAVAMVAEMQAQSESPLRPEEAALVRRTAHKSCLAQNAPPESASEAVEEAARKTETPAPSRKIEATRDDSFWDALAPVTKGSTDRSKGHERLRRRGRY
jgi:hypothetical protein